MSDKELDEWLVDTQRGYPEAMVGNLLARVTGLVGELKRARAELALHETKAAMYSMGSYGWVPTESGMNMLMALSGEHVSETRPAMVVLYRSRYARDRHISEHVVLPVRSFRATASDWHKSLTFENPVTVIYGKNGSDD